MKESVLDFIVNVEQEREIVILQLSDPQIIDSTQKRWPERLTEILDRNWIPENMDMCCFDILRETITAVNPDFIFITGDMVYGSFDDKGTSFVKFLEFMESFKIPWAPVFGNHDDETYLGGDWQCELLEKSEYCLFKRRNITGYGNYTVGIESGGKLLRTFFMLDSNNHSAIEAGFKDDQIKWYTDTAMQIKSQYPETKISFAFHIQPFIFSKIFEKYNFTGEKQINIDALDNKDEGDFGIIGAGLKSGWDEDLKVYNSIKSIGADSIFVGHEHANSASVVIDGIRFQYGQKSSTYDRANYITETGEIKWSFERIGKPIVGGTVLKLSSKDGQISDAYIYLANEN